MEYNAPVVQIFLRAGFIIRFSHEGTPSIATTKAMAQKEEGFDTLLLQVAGRPIDWLVQELQDMLKFVDYDFLPNKPLVSLFDAHSFSVYKRWDAFRKSVKKDIDHGWIIGPCWFPPEIPFRVLPCAAIPRQLQPDK